MGTLLALALGLGVISASAQAATINLTYTGTVISGSIDTENIFGFGANTDLTGLTATFTVALTSGASWVQDCHAQGESCWFDASGAGLLTETMTVAGGNTVSLSDTATDPFLHNSRSLLNLGDPALIGSNVFNSLIVGSGGMRRLNVLHDLAGPVNFDPFGTGNGTLGAGTWDAAFSSIAAAFANDAVSGNSPEFLFTEGSDSIIANITSVSAAPEPATATLLGGALAVLGLLRRRVRS